MRRPRLTAIIVVVFLALVLFVWVLIPPFPQPSDLVGKPISVLVSSMGPWKVSFPDKFVAWDKSRAVAIWTLEAGYRNWPVLPESVTESAKRCLWIQWAGVSVLCQKAVVADAK